MGLISKEIEAHYLERKESERLTSPLGELEHGFEPKRFSLGIFRSHRQ
jgi:hypothetical protein